MELMSPMSSDPVSPMNILAGWKLKIRKAAEAASQRKGKDGIGGHIDLQKIEPKNDGSHQSKTTRQPINPVNKVEGVDDHNDGKVGE